MYEKTHLLLRILAVIGRYGPHLVIVMLSVTQNNFSNAPGTVSFDFTRVRFLRSSYRNDLNYGPTTELRSCVRVEVEVLGSPSHIVRTVSVDVKQQWRKAEGFTSCAQSRRFYKLRPKQKVLQAAPKAGFTSCAQSSRVEGSHAVLRKVKPAKKRKDKSEEARFVQI